MMKRMASLFIKLVKSLKPPLIPSKKITPPEVNGPSGPEPTRFGDWERKGRAIDF